MFKTKLAGSYLALLMLMFANTAQAYDLSRFDAIDSENVERGFIELQGQLWMPAFGSFQEFHQVSAEFGAEAGFRIASIRGQHNFFLVGGLSYSPQKLDPDAVNARHNETELWLGYGGVRYIPNPLCIADGRGCLFFELRVGLVFEHADRRSGHDGPQGDLTVLPGVGYRFRFGNAFQLGVRADMSFSREDERDLGWVTLGAFIGVGW